MEVGTEISQKIRSAIKAKLIELGAYVDDELPDYIMVMVANKKSREQMISDLSLFLGKNTDTFAEWLHGLLGKLQTISVDSNATKNVKEKKKPESKKDRKVKKSSKGGEGSSQAKKVKSKKSEPTDGKIDKTVNSKSKGLSETSDQLKQKENTPNAGNEKETSLPAEPEIEDVRQMLVTVAPTDELAAELETTETRIEQSQQATVQVGISVSADSGKDVNSATRTSSVQRKRSASPTSERRVQSSSGPKKHKGLTSVVASVVSKDEEEEEYDPLCPAVGSVASVVKVTNRKSKVPQALQANRALLVKAMGEAERSIAIKRRILAPRSGDREDSPSEVYTPKRKKSLSGPEPSPPPAYIPSRKESSSTVGRSSSHSTTSQREGDYRRRGYSDSRSEHTRQTLSSQDRQDLVSRSRRMELLKHIGIDRKEEPVVRGGGSSSGSLSRHTRQSPKRTDSRKVAERDQREKLSSHSAREVSGRRRGEDDGVKDLKIKARLGPIVRMTSSEETKAPAVGKDGRALGGLDLRNKMTGSMYSASADDSIQIIVNPTTSPALKGSVASRLGKIVVKVRGSDSDVGNDGDNRGDTVGKGRMAISRLAKSLVNKQCREAVLSVNSGGRRLRRSVSPDSRRIEVSDDDSNEEEEEEDEEEVDKRSEVVADGKSVSITVKQVVRNIDRKGNEHEDIDNGDGKIISVRDGDNEEREPEDLAEMIGEKLEPELLNDNVQDDLNLDLEAEINPEDADDLETMIGVKSEDGKPKPGTRFIVTLDGVDERQLCADSIESAGKNMDSSSSSSLFIQPQSMAVGPMQKLSPSAPPYIPQLKVLSSSAPQQMPPPMGVPMQSNISPASMIVPGVPHGHFPSVAHYNIGDPHSLPPPMSTGVIPRGEASAVTKPLPPKIQPFSINLKDSDDEFEDKESRMHVSPSTSGGYINQTHSGTSLSALQKAKLTERCKFWPACAAGSECEFHHPTSYCKTFPNCKFADKCLFIHPNCKFDSKCTRQDCPFTHTSRRPGLSSSSTLQLSAPTIPFHHPKLPPPIPAHTTATVCRFFPNCHNPTCMFLHPKPCRFGVACQNPNCLFYHPTPQVVVPTKDKLTWKAQSVATTTTTLPKDISSSTPFSSTSLPTSDPTTKFRQPVAKVSPMSAASSSSGTR